MSSRKKRNQIKQARIDNSNNVWWKHKSQDSWATAVVCGSPKGVRSGIDFGIDVNHPIFSGKHIATPLQLACHRTYLDSDHRFSIVKLLLEAKADVNACASASTTSAHLPLYSPLFEACDNSFPSFRLVRLLVEARATSNNNENIFHMLARRCKGDMYAGHLAVCAFVLNQTKSHHQLLTLDEKVCSSLFDFSILQGQTPYMVSCERRMGVEYSSLMSDFYLSEVCLLI